MDVTETKKILGILKVAYPTFYKDMTRAEADNTVALWAEMFKDDSAASITCAVKNLICTLQFPPTIADIKHALYSLTAKRMTGMEAWVIVSKSISYYDSEAKFNSLPDDIKQIVGEHNMLRQWAMMESDIVQSVIQSNFIRSYDIKSKRTEQYSLMPSDIKLMAANLSEKLSITKP